MEGAIPSSSPPAQQPTISRVLIVDDDISYREDAANFLADQGCLCRGVSTGVDLSLMVKHATWSLVIINVEQPYARGLEQVRLIRAHSTAPILFTGNSLCPVNRTVVYELGADGYIPKSDDCHELWALARAVTRRQEIGQHILHPGQDRGGYRFAGWELDRATRLLTSPAGDTVSLTRTGYALLLAFLAAPGRILSRAHLLHATRKHEDIFDRSIDIQVLRLRQTLKRGLPERQLIRTERGMGYVLDCEVSRLH